MSEITTTPVATPTATPVVTLTDAEVKVCRDDAANARKEGRLETSSAPMWDNVVARWGNGKGENGAPKRAAILTAVLVAAGEHKDSPQKDSDGKRTPYGNVVQRFGARFDAAVKRATPDAPKPVTLRAVLSGEGGGSATIPADHALYAALVEMIGAESE